MNFQKPEQKMVAWQKLKYILSQQDSAISQSNLVSSYRKLIIFRLLSENIFIFLLQYSGLMLTPIPSHPIWFSSGTATAFIFLRGITIFPGIFFGNWLAFFLNYFSLEKSFFIAFVYALQPLLLYKLSLRFVGPILIFYNKLLFLKFIFLSGVITACLSLFLKFFFTSFSIFSPPVLFLWLANLDGLLFFAFSIISLDVFFPNLDDLKLNREFYFSLFLYLILCTLMIAFLFCTDPSLQFFLSLSVFVFIAWLGKNFGIVQLNIAIFLIGILLGFGAYLHAPLFEQSAQEIIMWSQAFFCLEIIFGYLLAIKPFSYKKSLQT